MIAQLNIFLRLCILHFIVGLFSPVFAGNATVDGATDLPDGIIGAVCIIRHENKMIMMSEVITKKISLPGGYIDQGDTPQQAAAREALEETGIVVTVGDLLQYRGRAAIYRCVAESPILVSSFKDHTGHQIVASWFSQHFATEIQRVYLIDPSEVDPKDYRYPDDAPLLGDWLERTPSSELEIYSDLSEQVNTLHRLELTLIRQFQQSIKAMPEIYQTVFERVMYLANLPGESLFIGLLVVVVAGLYGPLALLQLVVLLLLAIFTASLFKLGIASPRPSYIIPELQQINAYGFGFPSTHTLMATILWGMCWYMLSLRVSRTVKWLSLPLFFLLVIGQAVARVWFGVHFISDTIVSILLGLAMVSALIVWRTAARSSLQACIASKWFWLSVAIAIGVTASLTLAPVHVYIFAIVLGILFAVEALPIKPVKVPAVGRLVLMVILVVGLAAIGYGVEALANQSTVSLIVLAIRVVGWILAAFWLVAGTSLLSRKLAS
ncbi:phosphatase PAP2 family protein [Photobacterium sp. SDRW27]|uniref:bifunctional NUDIX hydrolase/phosphatase PAP2 family protein n=1 Tax=Photobacterium obscurum TaxID=2829490 RepID=UPI002244F4BF|nr:phosphatase PAP2 family protein [Photobacterium obscurum]MCW8329682.1 phosphatase PAP2 family protein [Photobacterium obscurum]